MEEEGIKEVEDPKVGHEEENVEEKIKEALGQPPEITWIMLILSP